MLREDVYVKTAEHFGISVGVAHQLGQSQIQEMTSDRYKIYKEINSVNKIINLSIIEGKYQQLQRELFKLRGNKRLKVESSIYKKAWNSINNIKSNGDKGNKTKSRKVLKEQS